MTGTKLKPITEGMPDPYTLCVFIAAGNIVFLGFYNPRAPEALKGFSIKYYGKEYYINKNTLQMCQQLMDPNGKPVLVNP